MASDVCVFCGIVGGELPASRVHESESVVAFLDIEPVNAGHLLVIPRDHIGDLAGIPDGLAAELFNVARELAATIRRTALRCEGVNLLLADGEAAGQEVAHIHLHVLPRFAGDGFNMGARGRPRPSRADLDEVATTIRTAAQPT